MSEKPTRRRAGELQAAILLKCARQSKNIGTLVSSIPNVTKPSVRQAVRAMLQKGFLERIGYKSTQATCSLSYSYKATYAGAQWYQLYKKQQQQIST